MLQHFGSSHTAANLYEKRVIPIGNRPEKRYRTIHDIAQILDDLTLGQCDSGIAENNPMGHAGATRKLQDLEVPKEYGGIRERVVVGGGIATSAFFQAAVNFPIGWYVVFQVDGHTRVPDDIHECCGACDICHFVGKIVRVKPVTDDDVIAGGFADSPCLFVGLFPCELYPAR